MQQKCCKKSPSFLSAETECFNCLFVDKRITFLHWLQGSHCHILFTGSATNQNKLCEIQTMAIKGILSSLNGYKEGLTDLSTLTLSLCVGMPPFFHYPTFLDSKYDIPVSFENSHDDKIKQLSSGGEHQVFQNRLLKPDDIFFHQTKLLYTIIIKSLN